MSPELLYRQLCIHEGLRLRPYRDSVGKLSIGVGRNLDDNGISQDEAEMLCYHDIQRVAVAALNNLYSEWRTLSDNRQHVLLDMAYNLGQPRLATFERMWSAIRKKDYESAADEILDSKYARQVGVRAHRLARMMRDDLSFDEVL